MDKKQQKINNNNKEINKEINDAIDENVKNDDKEMTEEKCLITVPVLQKLPDYNQLGARPKLVRNSSLACLMTVNMGNDSTHNTCGP